MTFRIKRKDVNWQDGFLREIKKDGNVGTIMEGYTLGKLYPTNDIVYATLAPSSLSGPSRIYPKPIVYRVSQLAISTFQRGDR
jgi:hypothetical protein